MSGEFPFFLVSPQFTPLPQVPSRWAALPSAGQPRGPCPGLGYNGFEELVFTDFLGRGQINSASFCFAFFKSLGGTYFPQDAGHLLPSEMVLGGGGDTQPTRAGARSTLSSSLVTHSGENRGLSDPHSAEFLSRPLLHPDCPRPPDRPSPDSRDKEGVGGGFLWGLGAHSPDSSSGSSPVSMSSPQMTK
jgi:hypothetical protein